MVVAHLLVIFSLSCQSLAVYIKLNVNGAGGLTRIRSNAQENRTVCAQMWDGKTVYGSDGEFQCDNIPLSPHWTWGGGLPPKMCLRPYSDFVSDIVKAQKRWPDCAELAFLWKKLPDASLAAASSAFAPCGGNGEKKLFVDVGANIGTCTMQMLSRPDVAQVVSFEPNPKNLFYLTSSVLNNPGSSSRLALFPMALGQADAAHKMFMTPGNAGNTVLDEAIAANPISDVQPVNAETTTLDEAFLDGKQRPYIHVMKVDAQGFEVHILKGGRRLLASGAINAIHFELAPAWLLGQKTSPAELFTILEANGYDVAHSSEDISEDAELPATLSHDDLARIACLENDVPPRDFIAIYNSSKALKPPSAIECS